MKTSISGMIELAGHEGICLSAYYDSVHVVTIGIGFTKSEIPNLTIYDTMTLQAVFDMFKTSIVKYEDAINSALTVSINQEQFDSLVSICYNIGISGLKNSTFMKRINNKDDMNLIVGAILMWNKPKEIMGRRRKEALLYSSGKYQNGGKANLFPVKNGHPDYAHGKEIQVKDYLTIPTGLGG